MKLSLGRCLRRSLGRSTTAAKLTWSTSRWTWTCPPARRTAEGFSTSDLISSQRFATNASQVLLFCAREATRMLSKKGALPVLTSDTLKALQAESTEEELVQSRLPATSVSCLVSTRQQILKVKHVLCLFACCWRNLQAQECQDLCRQKQDCGYFSFYQPLKLHVGTR